MYEVPEHVHHHRFTRFLRNVAHFRPLDQLSSRIEDVKTKVKNVKDLDAFRICPSEVASSSTAAEVPLETNSFSRDDHLVGIEKRQEELLKHLFPKEESSRDVVISVFGDAGSGKTTLICEVYEIVKGDFECNAWVFIPRSCEGLVEKLCEALELPIDSGKDRRRSLSSYLQQKRYILVLDGIWTENEWKCIANVLPCNNKNRRIIISTRKRNLASYCASSRDCIYDLSLNPLTWKEAWELFCKKVFQGGKCPDFLDELSKKIVKRCEGLPDAIVSIGNFLSNKPHTVMVFKSVHDSLEYEPGNCDYSVTCGRLIRLWIAEGFIEEKRGKTPEQVAYEYLDELVQMSLAHVSRWDFEERIRSCQVSNLAGGFILSKSEKDNFFTVLRGTRTSLGGEKTRRVSLHSCFPSQFQRKDLSYVRTISVFGGDSSYESMARKLFSKFRLLRVLDLENAPLQHFPEKVVDLTLQRYLSLRNTKIKSVPNSIKKLQNLMTFDLRQTLVSELPKTINELHKLIYLFLYSQYINHAAVGAEGTGDHRTQGRRWKEENLDLNHVSKPPQLINSLFLEGRLQKIPEWISLLNSLFKIKLRWSKLEDSPLKFLWALPSLKELHLYDDYTGKRLEFSAECFLELRMLEIEQCSSLNEVVIQKRAMPKLQKLAIRNCDNPTMVYITMNMLSQIEETHVPQGLIYFLD
ncbi:disease resistance protein RPM1-like [Fagus crenata]